MDVNQVLQSISEKQKHISTTIEIERNLDFDIGNLTAWDHEAITMPKAGKPRENYFKQLARDDVQAMLNKLYSIEDTEIRDGIKLLKLPTGTTVLPRAKPIPEPKQPTKWERFAKSKGIKSKSSKRRDKLNWDEEADKWVPRYGYKKAENDEQKEWVIEIPDNADPNVDYFAKREKEKKERISKNKFQQMRNVERSQGNKRRSKTNRK